MQYKRHIDGLRALAILPVLLFHLNNAWAPGGYAGVDIFFVISGFLITGILYKDIAANRFSLLEFYKRRILRIFPALFVVLAAVTIASELILFPSEKVRAGNSIAAAAGFASNILFWRQSGYFAAPSETNPLLHTWTLAVEEQFYIFFPLLLFLLFRYFRQHILKIIALLSILSFAACVHFSARHQALDFYLLPTRAWEFGIGAGLAIFSRQGRLPWAGNPVPAVVGFALIFGSFVFLNSMSVFPGWNAAYPCVGAMLLIGWAEDTPVGRLLSLEPFVWIGKISYSLYLWHWPLIAFWKIHVGVHLSTLEMVMLGLAGVLLGALSTRFVEQPFRTRRARALPAAKVVLRGAVPVAAMVCIGLLLANHMLPQLRTYPANVLTLAQYADYPETSAKDDQFRQGRCFISSEEGSFSRYDKGACATFDPSRPNVLLIGDSHAAHFWQALQEQFPDVNVMQATASGCLPLVGTPGQQRCTEMRRWVFETYLPAYGPKLDAVIVSARWEDGEVAAVGPTLERLKGLTPHVVLMGPTVEYNGTFPLLLARSVWDHQPFNFPHNLVAGRDELADTMAAVASADGVPFVNVYRTVCAPGQACTLQAPDGAPMEFDYGHFTNSGAREVISRNRATFASVFDVPDNDPDDHAPHL